MPSHAAADWLSGWNFSLPVSEPFCIYQRASRLAVANDDDADEDHDEGLERAPLNLFALGISEAQFGSAAASIGQTRHTSSGGGDGGDDEAENLAAQKARPASRAEPSLGAAKTIRLIARARAGRRPRRRLSSAGLSSPWRPPLVGRLLTAPRPEQTTESGARWLSGSLGQADRRRAESRQPRAESREAASLSLAQRRPPDKTMITGREPKHGRRSAQ